MKTERRIEFIVVLFVVFFISTLSAHAALELRGTDVNGNRLIYDSDLNITWYDYTKSSANWWDQMNWASALSVSGGDLVGVYDDWRLPSTVDGPIVFGYDGSTTAGYNITSSEMGHLFYTELGNKGYYATNGTNPQPGWGLTNTDGFQHLRTSAYWSGTEYAADTGNAWYFAPGYFDQNISVKYNSNEVYALAVRPGDVAVAPEPISSILFVTGVPLLVGRRYFRRGK